MSIFITKPGVTEPLVNEISQAAFAQYGQNLSLPILASGEHEFNAFEALKFRAAIDTVNQSNAITMNGASFQPFVRAGQGFLDGALWKATTAPFELESSGRAFLPESTLLIIRDAVNDENRIQLRSLNDVNIFELNTKSGAYTSTANVFGNLDDSVTFDNGETDISFVLKKDALEIKEAGVVLESIPRTWSATVVGGAGTMDSSGLAAGDDLPFSSSDTLSAAGAPVNGTMSIVSNFGNTTVYTVKVGAVMTVADDTLTIPDLTAQTAGVYDVATDFTGGTGTKSYTHLKGGLPPGMTFTGHSLSGTPSVDGNYSFVIRLTDELGQRQDIQYTVLVKPAGNVTFNPPPGVVDAIYSYIPKFPSGWSIEVASGVFPDGLTLDEDEATLTGIITGAAGEYPITLSATNGTLTETIEITFLVYGAIVVEKQGDNVAQGGTVDVLLQDTAKFDLSEGSGQFQYSITGGNLISSDGEATFLKAGEATITAVDTVTGEQFTFLVLVSGQGNICATAVETEETDGSSEAPCVDVITDCETPVTIRFAAMHILNDVDPGGVPGRESVDFDEVVGGKVSGSGKPYAMFQATNDSAHAIANNFSDGRSKIIQFVVTPSLAASAFDAAIGTSSEFANHSIAGLDYAIVLTTVDGDRFVEIRKADIFQPGSRFPVEEGTELGWGVYQNGIHLWVDGIHEFNLSINGFCPGKKLVFFASKAGMVFGGQVTNLLYEIETLGNSNTVGDIDAQTGEYTPGADNLSMVVVAASPNGHPNIIYRNRIQVIKRSLRRSLEQALLEGVDVDVWMADRERGDDLPLRFSRDGEPDANQIKNAEFLGIMQNAVKLDPQANTTEFNNDRGATSTGYNFTRIVVSTNYLEVRDLKKVKRIVPYMKEMNSHGVKRVRQYSSGCLKHQRVIIVWKNPFCDEGVPLYDCIELFDCVSYTPFSIEAGKTTQTNIPLVIHAFPDRTMGGAMFDYCQFTQSYVRI